jgi:peptidoglycan/LPS O-acetylase OafA/YrhL
LAILGIVFMRAGGELGNHIQELGAIRCVTQFWVGMALGAAYLRWPGARPGIPSAVLGAGCAIGAAVIALRAPSALLMPTAWSLVVCGVAWNRGILRRVLTAKPLVLAGDASYSTYMCHYLIYDVFKITAVGSDMTASLPALAVAFVAIGVASLLLYRYLERPAQNWCLRACSRCDKAKIASQPSERPSPSGPSSNCSV